MKESNKFKNKHKNLAYNKGSTLNQWGKTKYSINGVGPLTKLRKQ